MDKELIKQVVTEMVRSGELRIGISMNEMRDNSLITLLCGEEDGYDNRVFEGVEIGSDHISGYPIEESYNCE
ncbi:hypothetical protein Q5427_11150 [Brochothrix thermosphacta]|uniref:hypothetical protein n=1 Tax=Brochothrix thermosphacta TaxID=2756 RepID=UPI00271411E4|nr:hypothetical protein [Brochothrix thermosphacta]MDO7864846.1 hypothetical protein [Brochothrix thermosphacta]